MKDLIIDLQCYVMYANPTCDINNITRSSGWSSF